MPNIELYTPFPAQKSFIDKFVTTEDLFGVLVSPRGSGKSLTAMNICLFWALEKPNQKVGWTAPTFSQSKNILDQIVAAANEVIVESNRQEATITFVNGSTIKFLSSDSADNIRGFRFTHLIIDEAAYVKQSVIDTILLPTLNPNGKKCLMVSTPAGKNHLFTWYNKPEVVSHKIPLTECPYISEELIEEARKSLPPEIFKQEYLAEWSDQSNDVFLNVDKVSTVREWSTNRSDVYIGVDTGLSQDKSVLTIMNPMGRVLYMEGMNGENISVIANHFIGIMSKYNVVGGMIECNGVGQAMFDLIQPKYRRVKKLFMTQQIKTDIVRKLIRDMETLQLELPDPDLCPDLHREFPAYTYKLSQTGKLSFGHMPGMHDDYLDSLMMCNYSRVKFMERSPISVGNFQKITPMFRKPS